MRGQRGMAVLGIAGVVMGGVLHAADGGNQPANEAVTYAEHVAPILHRRCVECHREGASGPFALTNHETAAAWAESIVEATQDKRMPPWFANPKFGHFANDRSLSDADRDTLRHWAQAGCPPGDLTTVPPMPKFESDQVAHDVILPMSDRPFPVPADGVVDYQHFTIDPGWTEEKWISHTAVFPTAKSVVHHVLVFIRPPEGGISTLFPGDLVAAFVPGMENEILPEGMAFRVPAGSKIVMQMHYTPNGKATEDLTSVGFKFRDPKEVTHEVRTVKAMNMLFQIPPGKAEYAATARYTVPRRALLLRMIPHMHMRGRSMRYDLVSLDGDRETILDVPDYDFNWQLEYVLAQPRWLAAGTKVECLATFDNSANNPNNPDPSKWVTFGEQTWQEMLIGFFLIAEPRGYEQDRIVNAVGVAGAGLAVVRDWRRGETNPQRVASAIENFGTLLGHTQRLGVPITEDMQEIAELAAGGVREAEKQGALRDGPRPVDIGRGVAFLLRLRGMITDLSKDSLGR